MGFSRFTTFLSSVLLFAAIGLVTYGELSIPAPSFTGRLRDLLPPPPAGWLAKDKPIADSQEMQEAVGEMLNYDDGIFVDYIGPSQQRLSVYIAYWTPGKMSHRLIATHTPDVCWVGAGWKKEAGNQQSNLSTSEGLQIPGYENRVFTANGGREYVWFWHLVGAESKSYGTGRQPPWYSPLTDMYQKGIHQREEQFFIRLSGNLPLDATEYAALMSLVLDAMPWPRRT